MTRQTKTASDRETSLLGLLEAAHDAREEGLVVSTSGNLSVRWSEDAIVISAAHTQLGRLRRDQLAAVTLKDGSHRAGLVSEAAGTRPSRETPMHRAIYLARRSVGAVLHCQSPAATIMACSEDQLPDLNFIPEIPAYVKKVARVPFLMPGSEELADAVAEACRDEDVHIVQLGNHGQIAVGKSPAQVVERATFFELAAKMYLWSRAGPALRRFSAADLNHLRGYPE